MLVATLANNSIISKDYSAVSGTTNTPPLDYTPEVFYMMGNISALTNVRWYLGVPFFNTTPFDLSIVSSGQAILGDYLLAFQAGNEPDLYTDHGECVMWLEKSVYSTDGLISFCSAQGSSPLLLYSRIFG